MTFGATLNNPANIRFNKDNKWQGLVGSSHGFCKFQNLRFGVRAFFALMRTYMFRHGCCTIRSIITRFAPPSENNIDHYINFIVNGMSKYVDSHTGEVHDFPLDADTPLSFEGIHIIELAQLVFVYETNLVLSTRLLIEIFSSYNTEINASYLPSFDEIELPF